MQATITKSSPSAAWKTLNSGTAKLFHKFEGGSPKRAIVAEWGKVPQRLVDRAIGQWRRRLRKR